MNMNRAQENQFKELQKKLDVFFTDEKLLKQAFTHSSYVNEHRRKPHEDNERLNFRRCGTRTDCFKISI